MPPHIKSTRPSRIVDWASLVEFRYFFEAALLFLCFVTAVRSIMVVVAHKKKRMDSRLSVHAILNPTRLPLKKEDSGLDLQTESTSPRPSSQEKANLYLQSLKEETLLPNLAPIHPWIAPPQPLPGPYDAPYYPLPLPTIRRQSHESSTDPSEGLETISYTRRLSNNSNLSNPPTETVLEGSTTVSTQGWRRTQWTVSAG